MNKKGKIYVVGIGPGKKADMTFKAYEAMEKSDIIVGYKTYTDLIKEYFPDTEIINILLPQLEQVENEKLQETIWDGQAFQHKINKNRVEFEHTIFGICEEYPLWSCKFEEYKKVLESWKKFLGMEFDLKSEIVVEI